VLNYIWLAFILIAVIVGGIGGKFDVMTKGAFEMAKYAVMEIALPLVGIMAIWLGIMRLAERSGLVQVLSGALRPLLRRLFPDVPPDHPAHGAMVMNMAANMLGLGNAATPLGLRAMALLNQLNPRPGVATNAMCTFLAINTASIQLIPTTAIGILAVSGSKNPTAFVPAAILATVIAQISGITAAKLLERLPAFRLKPIAPEESETANAKTATTELVEVEKIEPAPLTPWKLAVLAAFFGFFVWLFIDFAFLHPSLEVLQKGWVLGALLVFALIAIPFLLSFFPLYAALRGVSVYEQFVDGAREAFNTATRIVPFLVAMLVSIRLLRDAGVVDELTKRLSSYLKFVGVPADWLSTVELLPMILMRPLSGSATQGIFVELINRESIGPDSLIGRTAATIYGSTETTFYVLAVYFGSVAIRQTRHAVLAGLIADGVAVVASVAICKAMFG
jgi:spore maturation protein SpmA